MCLHKKRNKGNSLAPLPLLFATCYRYRTPYTIRTKQVVHLYRISEIMAIQRNSNELLKREPTGWLEYIHNRWTTSFSIHSLQLRFFIIFSFILADSNRLVLPLFWLINFSGQSKKVRAKKN